MTKIDRIKANIERQQQRWNAAYTDAHTLPHERTPSALTYSEAMDEMGKAGRRLYQLRRELARAEAV